MIIRVMQGGSTICVCEPNFTVLYNILSINCGLKAISCVFDKEIYFYLIKYRTKQMIKKLNLK